MTAKIIDGKRFAEDLRGRIAGHVSRLKADHGITPGLAVVIVGEDIVTAGAGLIDLLLGAGGELVTVLTGDGVDDDVAEALVNHVHHHHLGTEIVTFHTGHRGDALLIGVE